MLRLNAPDNTTNYTISDHDYPESLTGRSGPGWSWMWVPYPFNSQSVKGQFSHRVFKHHRMSHGDLRAFIGENIAGHDRRWSTAAVAALRDVTAQEFVMVCSHVWAFASFEVPSGRSAEAGTAFYNGWVNDVNSAPDNPYVLMAADKPTVLVRR
ncbi:hypothetical protein ACFQ0M_46070 [Kitasatospora aburaviensis]|uniref:Uncharacterized protein n=1 Tax=Kitasatospora aburaviensis TaxID=67265 RepID=A0ABW1F689_9ACTN